MAVPWRLLGLVLALAALAAAGGAGGGRRHRALEPEADRMDLGAPAPPPGDAAADPEAKSTTPAAAAAAGDGETDADTDAAQAQHDQELLADAQDRDASLEAADERRFPLGLSGGDAARAAPADVEPAAGLMDAPSPQEEAAADAAAANAAQARFAEKERQRRRKVAAAKAAAKAAAERSHAPRPLGARDPVNQLITNLVGGGVDTQQLGDDKESKVALANKNEVHKVGLDEDDAQASQEAAVKKSYEAGMKRDQEQRQKIRVEAREKREALAFSSTKREEKMKQHEETLRLKAEMHQKRSMEQMHKQQEEAEKAQDKAERTALASKIRMERDAEVQRAELRAKEKSADARSELDQKKASEEVVKGAEAGRKRVRRNERRFKSDALKAKQHEAQLKQAAERNGKSAVERRGKLLRKRREEARKAAKQAKELARKERHKLAGRWCHGSCTSHRVYFEHNNRWHNCPDGKLLAGVYRGHYGNLANLYYFQCCAPCDEHAAGQQRVKVGACRTANWVRSFDREGWSKCPGNSFLAGLFKSSCNWIYCLEYARCCDIDGSKGRRDCSEKNWANTMDRAGWSMADADHFLSGLYRGSDKELASIAKPQQCRWFAYGGE